MRTHPLFATAALLFPLALAMAPAPAAADSPTIRVDIEDDSGEDVHLTINGGLLGTFIHAMAPIDIDCDDHHDPKVRALYLSLERGGDGSRGTVWDDESQIDAHRSGKFLEMRIHDEDGDIVDLKLPWSLARCVLGGENLSRREIDRALSAGAFSVHVQDEDSNVHVSID